MPTSRESLERWFRVGRILLGEEGLKGSRLMSVGVAVRSPLVLTKLNAEFLLAACEHDLPVVPTVCPMAGSAAPYSKAGTLLLGKVEIVFLAALAQMIRPGHPYLYAFGSSRTDMRSGEDLYYTLDKVLWKIAFRKVGRDDVAAHTLGQRIGEGVGVGLGHRGASCQSRRSWAFAAVGRPVQTRW